MLIMIILEMIWIVLALIGIIASATFMHNGGSKALGIVGIILSLLISPVGMIIGIVALKKSNK